MKHTSSLLKFSAIQLSTRIEEIVKDLDRCAKQNENDARAGSGWSKAIGTTDAIAVANEQRRMIRILKGLL